ncbi:tricarballylate dehydrogenase (plasmid) [Salinigranum rubrum]|uniref:Tricarballylate dehydrogenase n=1 Tax=Salinigranum rubrum TaxID=755307 RepID=A0A2I8VS05_9EURY|nr:FAD-dependent tricarballylate dehydrogenase TcuA [Salinigranum rubrum]AUV84666.1 tricarballylate dehydrogenase [Salinigranum rubrum]
MQQQTYDVVVIGSGMAGLAAGLRASEQDMSVAVLEKAPKKRRGGHTQFTETFRIPTADIDLDIDFNVNDYSVADFYSDLMKITEFKADEKLLETMTEGSVGMFEWLTERGIDWEYQAPYPGWVAGRVWIGGEKLIDQMTELMKENGVDVYYNADAQEFHRSDEGAVTGVTAFVDGTRTRFTAEATVLAAGDYGSSKEKRTKYYGPGFGNMIVRGSRYNTGGILDAAMNLGAKSEGEWGDAHMAIIDAGSPEVEGGITNVRGFQYGIIVNHEGERFLNEGADSRAHMYAKYGRKIFEQSYHESFVIVDSKVVDDVAHQGPTRPVTADSIETLVQRLDIEKSDRAVESIEAFNEACDPDAIDHYDPNSLDDNSTVGVEPPKSNWAIPLDEPPFTGYPVTGGMTFGFGGVATTPKTEVLDTRDEIIPGFFAAGNSTGGLLYNNYAGGTGLTNAAVFGKIAGEQAAAYVEESQ